MAPASKIVCECLGVREDAVLSAARREGLTTVRQVTACTGAGGGCTACHPALRALLDRVRRERAAQAALPPTAIVSAK